MSFLTVWLYASVIFTQLTNWCGKTVGTVAIGPYKGCPLCPQADHHIQCYTLGRPLGPGRLDTHPKAVSWTKICLPITGSKIISFVNVPESGIFGRPSGKTETINGLWSIVVDKLKDFPVEHVSVFIFDFFSWNWFIKYHCLTQKTGSLWPVPISKTLVRCFDPVLFWK